MVSISSIHSDLLYDRAVEVIPADSMHQTDERFVATHRQAWFDGRA